MSLSKNYEFKQVENKWYSQSLEKGYFSSMPDERPAYTIVIPPPNVTGVLHMGHTLNETVQDILARRARMEGFNVCWVPGSDHASIATEAKVVGMLKAEKGIEKKDLTREEFLKHAYEWKNKYGGIIYDQIKKLGCSCDWNRVSFTMDEDYYHAVVKIFVRLYEEGLIYRGARMINWDPSAKTALSDEEVEFKDENGKLYHIKYYLADDNGNATEDYLVVATKRPETIMGDTAICVNPNDERYQDMIGKKVLVPMTNRTVSIISDEYVELDFGTGILKVTPAHDINDYEIGLRHGLEVIDTLNDDGTISEAAGIFVGLDRFVARRESVNFLQENDQLEKTEEYISRIGYSQRTGVIVEPRISTQWFMKMDGFAKSALQAVENGDIQIYPKDRFNATYNHWLSNIKDWCISRQLWWGQRIPAFYDANGEVFVAENIEEALKKARLKNPEISQLIQDEDCLDTWFSSWIWPMQVFKGITHPNNPEVNYYYPTKTLVTGQDIIFFWVARMVMAGYHFENQKPFSDVYFTGIVRDSQGRKMSKSLGNSPDLLNLIDQFGADAVRFGIMICSPAGNDLLFSEEYLEQGRHFNNKIWNALKLVKIWNEYNKISINFISKEAEMKAHFHIYWMKAKLEKAKVEIKELYGQYKLSQILKTLYSLIWDDFCSWFLEWSKPEYGSDSIDAEVYDSTIYIFEELMQLLHPFMPFITEEIYGELAKRNPDDLLIIKPLAEIKHSDEDLISNGDKLKEIITSIRNVRTSNQLKNKDSIQLFIDSEQKSYFELIETLLCKQCNVDKYDKVSGTEENVQKIVLGKDTIYITSEFFKQDNVAHEEKMLEDLKYYQGFLSSVQKKLSNEKFMQNAKPEVVELERKKEEDTLAKIKAIEEAIGQK